MIEFALWFLGLVSGGFLTAFALALRGLIKRADQHD